MTFKFLLSAEAHARIEAEHRELSRLYALTNRWLASALLDLARRARAEHSRWSAFDQVYDAQFIWHGVPELASRLGAVRINADEALNPEWQALTDKGLRQRLGYCVANISTSYYHEMLAWSLLIHTPANGNPVLFGIDRICPGTPGDRDDPFTRALDEIAGTRGVPFNGRWTPDLLLS